MAPFGVGKGQDFFLSDIYISEIAFWTISLNTVLNFRFPLSDPIIAMYFLEGNRQRLSQV